MKTIIKFACSLILFLSFFGTQAQNPKIEARLIKSIDEFDNGEIIAKIEDIVTDGEFLYFLD